MQNMTVALELDTIERIKGMAKEEKRPPSTMARILLEEAIEAREENKLCISVIYISTG